MQKVRGARVCDLPGELGGRQAQVEGHEHGAEAGDGVNRNDEGGAVARQYCHDVGGSHALAFEVGCRRIDGGIELGKGEAVVTANESESRRR